LKQLKVLQETIMAGFGPIECWSWWIQGQGSSIVSFDWLCIKSAMTWQYGCANSNLMSLWVLRIVLCHIMHQCQQDWAVFALRGRP
jgi:hypothetical protein